LESNTKKKREEDDFKLAVKILHQKETPPETLGIIGTVEENLSFMNYGTMPGGTTSNQEENYSTMAGGNMPLQWKSTVVPIEGKYGFMPSANMILGRSVSNGSLTTGDSDDYFNRTDSLQSSSSTESMYSDVSVGHQGTSLASNNSRKRENTLNMRDAILNHAVRIGWLHKRGGGKKSTAWKHRWFILSSDRILYYFKNDKEKKTKGSIQLGFFAIESYSDTKREHCFMLIPPTSDQRTWYLGAHSTQDKIDWMNTLRTIQLEVKLQ